MGAPESPSPGRSYHAVSIRPEMTVRHVVALYPETRELFRNYGEPDDRPGVAGKSGPFGHFQPLRNFALAHDVDVDELLDQLSGLTGVPIDRDRESAERIHRGFIVPALLITLTLGAGWGAYLLYSIGSQHDFSAARPAHVIAHGEAQLWGFIGFFIIGVALRTLFKDAVSTGRRQRLCYAAIGLALLGLAGGFAWSLAPQGLAWLGIGSAVVLLGLSVILWIVQWQAVKQKWRATWSRAVFMSGFWLTVWAGYTVLLRFQAAESGPSVYSQAERLLIIKLAVFGFAMNSIYGFGQMLLPGLLRLGKLRLRPIEASFWLHNFGVVAMVVASLTSVNILAAILEPLSALAVLTGAVCFAFGQRGLIAARRGSRRLEQGHRSLDVYPPLAFAWLVTSLVLLSAGEIYAVTTGQTLSHAYTGAVRHALTVGFMTTLILGVAQRLLPVLEHHVLRSPGLVMPILILIGTGNLLRVSTQMATIRFAPAYWLMPFSAILEWTALLLFTISVFRQFWTRDSVLQTHAVTARTSLAELLAAAPWIEDELIARGSAYLVRARTVPSELTIESFASSEKEDPAELVDWINQQLSSRR